MGEMASQITSVSIVCSTIYSGADQRKHQTFLPLAFVRGIHRWPVNSPHKGPVTQKMFPFDGVIMNCCVPKWQPFCPGGDELTVATMLASYFWGIVLRQVSMVVVWYPFTNGLGRGNYNHGFMWNVIIHPCPNFTGGLTKPPTGGLTKPPLMLGHGLVLHPTALHGCNRIWWIYRSTLVEWYKQLVLPIDH